jgi:hypothetical protein
MGSRNNNRRHVHLWLILVCTLGIAGCSLGKIKTGLMTGAATATTVAAATALTSSVIAPAVVGGVTGATVSALTAEPSVKGEPISVTADTVVNKAPDNFWTLLGKLISMGGWALILIVIVPMLFSWLLPGPIQFKGKKKK